MPKGQPTKVPQGFRFTLRRGAVDLEVVMRAGQKQYMCRVLRTRGHTAMFPGEVLYVNFQTVHKLWKEQQSP